MFQLFCNALQGGGFLEGAFLEGPEGAFFRGGALKVGRKYSRTPFLKAEAKVD